MLNINVDILLMPMTLHSICSPLKDCREILGSVLPSPPDCTKVGNHCSSDCTFRGTCWTQGADALRSLDLYGALTMYQCMIFGLFGFCWCIFLFIFYSAFNAPRGASNQRLFGVSHGRDGARSLGLRKQQKHFWKALDWQRIGKMRKVRKMRKT